MVGFPNNHGVFLLKNDHFGVFWGYHHLRKHPYRGFFQGPIVICGVFQKPFFLDPQQKPTRITHPGRGHVSSLEGNMVHLKMVPWNRRFAFWKCIILGFHGKNLGSVRNWHHLFGPFQLIFSERSYLGWFQKLPKIDW